MLIVYAFHWLSDFHSFSIHRRALCLYFYLSLCLSLLTQMFGRSVQTKRTKRNTAAFEAWVRSAQMMYGLFFLYILYSFWMKLYSRTDQKLWFSFSVENQTKQPETKKMNALIFFFDMIRFEHAAFKKWHAHTHTWKMTWNRQTELKIVNFVCKEKREEKF